MAQNRTMVGINGLLDEMTNDKRKKKEKKRTEK